jgi:translation initiation factor 5A
MNASSNSIDSNSSEHSDSNELIPKQSSALRRNDIVVLKGKPCKIVEMSTSKPGKHGHAKIHFVGIDIFTGKKYEDICPSSKNMMVPEIIKKEFHVSLRKILIIIIYFMSHLSLLILSTINF